MVVEGFVDASAPSVEVVVVFGFGLAEDLGGEVVGCG